MTKRRFLFTLNCLLLISLILTACAGAPTIPLPDFLAPTPTTTPASATDTQQRAFPPALVETFPPFNSVLGHFSPIIFYFNQDMNKASVEAAFSGLPVGIFTWNDEATVVFTPTAAYPPNSKLKVSIVNSIQSATGFGLTEPLELSFTVADYLRATNQLPKANTLDVNVDAAISVSFNQPVVPLGADSSALPAAFTLVPSVPGRGEWINTSTYIFYPEPAMAGGTEYAVSLSQDLRSVTGVGFAGIDGNAWKFVTSTPQVVSLSPSAESPIPLDPEIKLTFNQPMDTESVQANFLFSGPGVPLNGTFTWNDDDTELIFTPEKILERNIGYLLTVGAAAKSRGALGVTLGTDYSAAMTTFDNFAVTLTSFNFGTTTFTFSAPLAEGEYEDFVNITPALDTFEAIASENRLDLAVYGNFTPDTNYVIELSARLKDQWGQSLGDPFILNVRTPPLPATLNVRSSGSSALFVRPDEPVLYADVTNIQRADVTVAPLSLQEFFSLQSSYENQQSYIPTNTNTYSQSFNLLPSVTQEARLSLAPQNSQLLPGLYYVNATSPQIISNSRVVNFAVSSQVNLTFKRGATEAFIWAVDLPSQTPVANAPVVIYDNAGNQLSSGLTDASGLWKGTLGDYEGQLFAVLGTSGEENFSLALSNWNMGINTYDFGYPQNVRKPRTEIYMYTDRPIYRPGQTVYFRGVVREAFNGRYQLPTINNIPINLIDANGIQLADISAQLSPYGTFNGEFKLPEGAAPGYYQFVNVPLELYFSFQVAEYRKPEIDLNVDFAKAEIKLGDTNNASINARYFFDAPAGNVNVKWAFYTRPDYFYLPNYQTGLFDDSWLDAFRRSNMFNSDYFGQLIGEGTGQTTPRGILSIDLPAIPEAEAGQIVTLEVTAEDESGLPVSARTELRVHPADFYIGLRPDQWFGTAKEEIGFEVYTVDWSQAPSGDKPLTAEFKQVRWEKETDINNFPTYTPIYTPISSSNLATGPDGKARLSFIPPTAGTYMLDVSGQGAHTQTLIWVGGAGSAAWPDLPNQRLELKADKDSYKAGDTAKVFIPNPFAMNALALVTVERGIVSKAEVITVSGSGQEYTLPLTEDDAPNVYVNVTILGQGNDFRQGLVNIPVAPDAQELNVQVIPNPGEAGPRDNVTFDVIVTDNQGQPVEGEFSLSVVDQAVLALADPNAQDILPAYYSNQPLGIETGLSLAAYGGRNVLFPGGMGGGGGGDVFFLREDFPDTAYWNPSFITNAEGRGQVTMTLPDSLTTWQVDVRGLTVDTKVGQGETQIVSTKPLLIRPVTPRFLVSGDHVLMAAIINNNTANPLTVAVNLQSDGFVLDDPGKATFNLEIPANGRSRVEWWGTAGLAESADVVFSAITSGTPSLQDSARPVWGKLPILKYTAPQAFVTGGVLRDATSQQEVISLPRTYVPTSGGLDVELSPSLAGNLLSALDAMESPDESQSAEAILSYLLPHLEVYRALNNEGVSDPELTERITAHLNSDVSQILSLQNTDGGWSWWKASPIFGATEGGERSDPYISAYVFFGLQQARAAGAVVSDEVLSRVVTYLQSTQPMIDANTKGAALDEIAFVQFALSQAGLADAQIASTLWDERNRLSPASRAWVAYIFNKLNPADPRVRELISNLETSAIVTSSSAHWETQSENIFTRGTTIYTTSIVVYVLGQIDPANQVLFNAVRYLAAHRSANGLWNIGHDNAWAIIALNAAMVGIGDLRADFAFNAALNGAPLTSGDIAGTQLTPLTAHVPLENLAANASNLLTINREDGLGRLYYNAVLNISRPVEDVQPLDNGMRIDRVFCSSSSRSKGCAPLSSVQLASTQPVSAQLTLVLPHDSYYVMVEDFIPAGMEILNRNLKTSQLGVVDTTDAGAQVQFDDKDPFADGWGWWLFNEPQIRDDSILFSAEFLPAGTYVLTYTLMPLQAGEYRVLPAHAWQSFFPEVQGTGAGAVFEIKP